LKAIEEVKSGMKASHLMEIAEKD